MQTLQEKILTWDEIKNQYPDEWVVLGNTEFDGMKILTGTVLSHHPDKRVASMEGVKGVKDLRNLLYPSQVSLHPIIISVC